MPPFHLVIVWQDYVGRSGLLASFSLIFASEIGDKTFFIAGLLAMRVGRTLAFTGERSCMAGSHLHNTHHLYT